MIEKQFIVDIDVPEDFDDAVTTASIYEALQKHFSFFKPPIIIDVERPGY